MECLNMESVAKACDPCRRRKLKVRFPSLESLNDVHEPTEKPLVSKKQGLTFWHTR